MTKFDRFSSTIRVTAGEDPVDDATAAGDEPRFDVVVLCALDGADERPTVLRFDRDRCDEVLARLYPTWRGPVAGEPVAISFTTIDDFDPDRLLERVAPLAALVRARRDPAGATVPLPPPAAPASPAPPVVAPAPPPAASGSMLEEMIAATEAAWAREEADRSPIRALAADLAAPHSRPVERGAAAQRAAVDAALAAHLRALLHDPEFRRIEASWRDLRGLMMATDSTSRQRLWLAPCEPAGLRRLPLTDPEATPLAGRLLVRRPALLVVDASFGPSPTDVRALAGLASLARALGAPCIANASPALLGRRSFAEVAGMRPDAIVAAARAAVTPEWQALRDDGRAGWIALAGPRLLGRLPYGSRTRPLASVPFEEATPEDDRGSTAAWSSPAVAVAAAAVRAFALRGADFDPRRDMRRIDGLPLVVDESTGEAEALPCTEVLLNDGQIEALSEVGILPLCAERDRGAASLPFVQSIAALRAALPLGRLRTPTE